MKEIIDREQRERLLEDGHNIINVIVDGKYRYILPEPLEEKVFDLYDEWVEAPFHEGEVGYNSQKIENNLRFACDEIVERWFPDWKQYENLKYPH